MLNLKDEGRRNLHPRKRSVLPISADSKQYYTDAMVELMRRNEITCIDMTPLVEPLDFKERIVSRKDPHPSIKVHRIAAEALYRKLQNANLR